MRAQVIPETFLSSLSLQSLVVSEHIPFHGLSKAKASSKVVWTYAHYD